MSTPHNSAAPGDFAKTVLMPGDPLRAQFIAENFLNDCRLVNNVRGIQGYTGTYKGVPVSVMASGMGMPSMGIYSYELFNFYGVENILRVGSVGALSEKLHVRDIVLAQGACTNLRRTVRLPRRDRPDRGLRPAAHRRRHCRGARSSLHRRQSALFGHVLRR